jgi:hypothetical protein
MRGTGGSASGRVAAIGEAARVQGLGLAGALVLPAETAGQARRQWADLPPDVVVVVLTPSASAALDAGRTHGGPLTVVMPP